MSMICRLISIPRNLADELFESPDRVDEIFGDIDPESFPSVCLEKSWHGLHFLLTGSAWGGNAPLNVLVAGGEAVGDQYVGYGPPRIVRGPALHELSASLNEISEVAFAARLDPSKLAAADIYPSIWHDPIEALVEEYSYWFGEFKSFVTSTADRNESLLILVT